MADPLLKISNHHVPASGDPPIVDGEVGNQYIGYFENSFSEQWIFTYDYTTRSATLRGGDIGWNEKIDVTNGCPDNLILGQEEQLWLKACMLANQKQRTAE